MRPKTALTLFVIAMAMLAFILFVERRSTPAYQPRSRSPAIPELAAEMLSRICVSNLTGLKLELVHTNGQWWLTQPVRYPANDQIIGGLVDLLAALDDRTALIGPDETSPARAAEFGLDPAQYTIEFQSGPTRTRVLVGKLTPLKDRLYVRVNGRKPVYLAGAALAQLLPRTADDWRDRRLIGPAELQCTRLMLTSGEVVIELERESGSGQWRLSRPINARADSPKITRLLAQLGTTWINRFVSDSPPTDLDRLGLRPPALEITFMHGTNMISRLRLGTAADEAGTELYAMREGTQTLFTVPADQFADWRGKLDDFRDRRLVEFDPGRLEKIRVVSDQSFVLELADGAWRISATTTWPADTNLVGELLGTLASLEIFQFVKQVVTEYDLPTFGFGADSRRIAFHMRGAASTNGPGLELEFGRTEGNRVYVRRSDEPSVYAIRITDFARLPWRAWQLRERRPWRFSENEVTRVVVTERGRKYEFLRTGTNNWIQASGPHVELNPFGVEETVHRLGELRVVSWVGVGSDARPQFGFTEQSDAVEVETQRGAKYRLEFGGATPFGSLYGAVALDGTLWIGELPRAICEYVRTYLTAPDGE